MGYVPLYLLYSPLLSPHQLGCCCFWTVMLGLCLGYWWVVTCAHIIPCHDLNSLTPLLFGKYSYAHLFLLHRLCHSCFWNELLGLCFMHYCDVCTLNACHDAQSSFDFYDILSHSVQENAEAFCLSAQPHQDWCSCLHFVRIVAISCHFWIVTAELIAGIPVARVSQTIPYTLMGPVTISSVTNAGKLVGCLCIFQTRRKPHIKIAPAIYASLIMIFDSPCFSLMNLVYNWPFFLPSLCLMPFFNSYGEVYWNALPC